MVSREQALTASEFHFGKCTCPVGPRGGRTIKVETWRRNGATVLWKRDPKAFRVPIKFGLRECSYLDNGNARSFHVAEECPLREESGQ